MNSMSTLGMIFLIFMSASAAVAFLCLMAMKEASRPHKVKRYPGD